MAAPDSRQGCLLPSTRDRARPSSRPAIRRPRPYAAPRSWCSLRICGPVIASGVAAAEVSDKAEVGEWLDTPMQDVLAARPLSRKVGYLRIWSFDLDDDDAFVTELIRLLGLLPPDRPDRRPARESRWPDLGRRAGAAAVH